MSGPPDPSNHYSLAAYTHQHFEIEPQTYGKVFRVDRLRGAGEMRAAQGLRDGDVDGVSENSEAT